MIEYNSHKEGARTRRGQTRNGEQGEQAMSENLNVLKNNVVTQMFVDTADQNYVIARWAYHRGLFLDFFWNARQALEKYLKASLLLNGKSAKDQKHDLTKFFADVKDYADEFFPPRLTQPPELKQLIGVSTKWRDETPEEFIARFNDLGDSNNRYNVFGYIQRWEDLHHFDQMVYAVRWIAFNLDVPSSLGPPSATGSKTVRETLKSDPGYSPRSIVSRLYKILSSKKDDELRDAGLKYNFQFAPANYEHPQGIMRIGTSATNSALYQRIVRQAERTDSSPGDREAVELGEWVIKNIVLTDSIKKELRGHIQTLQKRTL